MKIRLPELLWYGNTTAEYDLPDAWDVEYCPMRGANRTPLTPEELRNAILNPIGVQRLKDQARDKKSAVIIFDDMTRPTRTYDIAPILVEELLAGGIKEENITFVCALGTHGALTMNEFRKKLGPDIPERFRVFNHNIYENCVEVGTTSRGTKLMINREVMESDLKIAVGCVTAHAQVGFSGGGKIVLPGVAHVDSISHYHLQVEAMAEETTGLGKHAGNILRREIDEAAGMVGLDFAVNVLVNGRGATTEALTGELFEVHAKAVELAKEIYDTDPIPVDKELVIANAFAKANEMPIAIRLGALALNDFTGTVVVIANSPEGQVVHYLLDRWGKNYGGRQYPVGAIPPSANVIVMAPYLDKTFGDWMENPEVITWTKNWEQTLEVLNGNLGPGTRAAVIPNATMQYFSSWV
jgi:nickel-dependent lactate racemase